jgi:large subunit ribosomal protein L24
MKKYTKINTRNQKKSRYAKRNLRVLATKMKIKKGDKVKVISGKDKGKSGLVLRSFPKTRRVIVEGMNVHKRHTRRVGNQSGRIVEKSLPIDASNVAKIS